ncbi:MAG: substrate-binding domain-containing protein [Chthoniobacteraceae bacterium]
MQSEPSTKQEMIFSSLQSRIVRGEWGFGAQIPTEDELAAEFHCSRGTVGRAVARLVQEGLVERKTRMGTRVIRNSIIPHNTATIDLDACAFIYPADQHEGVWRTGRGFERAAYAAERRTLMLSTGSDFRKEAEIVGRLAEFDVKGAVLFPVTLDPSQMIYYAQMIHSCPFPVVLVELNIAGLGRPSVVVDGLHAGYTMTRHLLRQGAKRIGFFANYAWTSSIRDRYLGYRQALEDAGLPENREWVMMEPTMTPNFEDPFEETIALGSRYLEKSGDLEGVVCSSDYCALGVIRSAQARGISVPESLKVTGVDDFAIAASSKIPLTTYHVRYEDIGIKAFETLNTLMRGEPLDFLEIQVRGELVARQSA